MDAHNSITQGLMIVEGDALQMTFRSVGFDGKPGDFRVTVSRKTNDLYNWLLEQKQPDAWKQVLALEYLRSTVMTTATEKLLVVPKSGQMLNWQNSEALLGNNLDIGNSILDLVDLPPYWQASLFLY